MTREKFIKKWLANRDYDYDEHSKDLMREDLDKVIGNFTLNDDEIRNLSTKFMASGKTMGGGDAGWIQSAYEQGVKDTINYKINSNGI